MGRPADAKFVARPWYVYRKLKMSGTNGVITISGDPKHSNECDDADTPIVETLIAAVELAKIQKEVDAEQMPAGKNPIVFSFQSAKDTKKVQVGL